MSRVYSHLILLIVFFSCTYCSKNNSDPKPTVPTTPATPSIYTTYIYYKNSSGQDLLNPDTPGSTGQRTIDVSWYYNNNTIVFTRKVTMNTSDNSLPAEYCFTIDNDSGWGLMKFMSFNDKPLKVDTLTFSYDGTVLKKLMINKINIDPPSGMTAFPAHIPIVILK
jgi:hypothetical protein